MAISFKSLDVTRASKPRANKAKIQATTEARIARQIAEDPDTAPEFDSLTSPLQGEALVPDRIRQIRAITGLSQDKFASALGIPAGTLRNWEQGRNKVDPAARTLLLLVELDPVRILKMLETQS